MHVTKASSDDDDFGCEYTALSPVSRFPFLSQAAWLHCHRSHLGGFLTPDTTGAETKLLFKL